MQEEKIKHGELQEAILKTLRFNDCWMTARQIYEFMADALDIHTTDQSTYVTLNKMVKNKKIKANYSNRCKCCKGRLIAYKIILTLLLLVSNPYKLMAEPYEMGEPVEITITATVKQLFEMSDCGSPDSPVECVVIDCNAEPERGECVDQKTNNH